MAERLDALVAPVPETAPASTPLSAPERDLGPENDSELPPGWRMLTLRDGWKPAPIGVHVG